MTSPVDRIITISQTRVAEPATVAAADGSSRPRRPEATRLGELMQTVLLNIQDKFESPEITPALKRRISILLAHGKEDAANALFQRIIEADSKQDIATIIDVQFDTQFPRILESKKRLERPRKCLEQLNKTPGLTAMQKEQLESAQKTINELEAQIAEQEKILEQEKYRYELNDMLTALGEAEANLAQLKKKWGAADKSTLHQIQEEMKQEISRIKQIAQSYDEIMTKVLHNSWEIPKTSMKVYHNVGIMLTRFALEEDAYIEVYLANQER